MFAWLRRKRREKLLADPFPPHWDAVLRRNVALYPKLSADEQRKLRDITRVLVAEKKWEAVRGLFVTEEMKVTVAAQAALLLIGLHDHDYFARVPSVVIHPKEFSTPVEADGWEDDQLSDEASDGMAVHRGAVLLNWESVLFEARDPDCGQNIVLHEFAHALDAVDGTNNGTPPLPDDAAAAAWYSGMQAAIVRHREDVAAGREQFFTEHAATNEGEFFADATEAFYCVPTELEAEEPEVFALLRGYYGVDPRVWSG